MEAPVKETHETLKGPLGPLGPIGSLKGSELWAPVLPFGLEWCHSGLMRIPN